MRFAPHQIYILGLPLFSALAHYVHTVATYIQTLSVTRLTVSHRSTTREAFRTNLRFAIPNRHYSESRGCNTTLQTSQGRFGMKPRSLLPNPSLRYQPLEPTYHNAQGQRYHNIEMNQQPSQFSYQPSSPNLDQKGSDSKAYFQNDNNEPPARHWPMQSQHVATITPLRGIVIVFDAILASTPIMFIGMSIFAISITCPN
jgi:hypothetical protein